MKLNISTYFKLNCRQPELEFIDIDLNKDNLLFVDPRLIEMGNDIYSKKMQRNIEVFWAEIIKAVKRNDKRAISSTLDGLKEPKETRLGYASNTCDGNSIARKLKKKLIGAIMKNKAVQSGQLSQFCDFEFFIDDVSSDRISDMVTKIVKDVLVEFTQHQCQIHKIPMKLFVQDDFLDITKGNVSWIKEMNVELPFDEYGEPIIFVPKNIVRLQGAAGQNLRCLYRFAIREFVQNDKEMLEDVSPTGKDGKILLRDVKVKHPISKESLTAWYNKYGKLIVDFKTDVLSERIHPLSDEQIMNVIYEEDIRNAS
ncbi:hypothetical protein [Neptunitalea lumnitzerae]|uniref:Uncharacterized protein n=1 Tax=Neptunitalea lumnitzerae TaxID=2965509 RepID=A0ABQ5MGN0_9FLAO|nr:hypothetical protein [Neptunitalea sp. Y10]GLB48072.1 hypothetical protein Y10_04400 [Neptunitalea sp. Y10]